MNVGLHQQREGGVAGCLLGRWCAEKILQDRDDVWADNGCELD